MNCINKLLVVARVGARTRIGVKVGAKTGVGAEGKTGAGARARIGVEVGVEL